MNCRLIPFSRLAESWNACRKAFAVRSSARPNGTSFGDLWGVSVTWKATNDAAEKTLRSSRRVQSAHEGAGIAITARRLASCRQRAARRSQPAHIAAEFCDDRSSRRGDLIAKWIAGRAAFGFWRHQIVLAVAGETRRGRPSWGGACRLRDHLRRQLGSATGEYLDLVACSARLHSVLDLHCLCARTGWSLTAALCCG